MEHENNEHLAEKPVLKLIIDQKVFEWNQQYITGREVRELGNISEDVEVFLKISPPWTDEPVTVDANIDLTRPGIEHFYSVEKVSLIVNGRAKPWDKPTISFDELIILAFGNVANNPNTVFTVTFKHGPKQNPEGSMVRGDSIYVKNKMVFNVTATDKS